MYSHTYKSPLSLAHLEIFHNRAELHTLGQKPVTVYLWDNLPDLLDQLGIDQDDFDTWELLPSQ